MRINGIEYELTGYDDYQEVFEEYALPEFKSEAEELLLAAVSDTEPEAGENVEIILDGEKAKSRQPAKFIFLCQKPDDRMSEKQIAYCWVED